jgi:hypothetical protein
LFVRLVVLLARAGVPDTPERATTRRPVVFADGITPTRAARAGVICCVVLRCVVVVAVRDAGCGRGTTRLSAPILVVFTTVLIGLNDCDVVTPGFKFVRI